MLHKKCVGKKKTNSWLITATMNSTPFSYLVMRMQKFLIYVSKI